MIKKMNFKAILFIAITILCFSFLHSEIIAEQPSNYNDPDAGTESNPYLISNLANLRWLSEHPDDWWIDVDKRVYFNQTANIDATETIEWNSGKGFIPIGYPITSGGVLQHRFYGVYNGSNHSINNLYINQENDYRYIGLFGQVINSILEDINLENIIVSTLNIGVISYTGGIAGWIGGSMLENCSVSGNINHQTSTSQYTGGIAGTINVSSIKNIQSATTINGNSSSFSSNAGGIAGSMSATTVLFSSFTGEIIIHGNTSATAGGITGLTGYSVNIESSFSSGNILVNTALTGIHNISIAGGIIGSLDYDSIIFNSFTSGEIIALGGRTSYAGGIAGSVGDGSMLENLSSSIIDRCYSIAMISGNVSGGIAGILDWSYIFNSFWDMYKTWQYNSVGVQRASHILNTHGLSTHEMKQADTYINNDWDFNFSWNIDSAVNDGYPFLNMMTSPYHRIQNLYVYETDEGLDVRWTIHENSQPSSFTIYRDGEILVSDITDTSYLDTSFINYFIHDYLVIAHYSSPNGLSAPSYIYRVWTTLPPRNLTYVLEEIDVVLNWDEPLGGGNVRYVVFRNGRLITETWGIVVTTFTDNTAVPGQTYIYGVSAAYIVHPIEWYTVPIVVQVTIPGGNPPQNLIAKTRYNEVELNWEEPFEILDFEVFLGYNIYRESELLTEEPIQDLVFFDIIQNEGIFLYSVTAVYELGESNPIEIEVEIISSENDISDIILGTKLIGNYPNPFNPETTIRFNVAIESMVSIDIYNIRGQRVKRLLDGFYERGSHTVVWDGRDDSGRELGSGVYFYRMMAGDIVETRRMVLLK